MKVAKSFCHEGVRLSMIMSAISISHSFVFFQKIAIKEEVVNIILILALFLSTVTRVFVYSNLIP